jgi:hypothetical protein
MSSCARIRDSIDVKDYQNSANALIENVKTLHIQLTQFFYEARDIGGRCSDFMEIILKNHTFIHESLSRIENAMQEFCFIVAEPSGVNVSVPTELFSALETVNLGLDALLSAYEQKANNVFTNFECAGRLSHIMLILRIWDVRFASMQDVESEFKNFDGWRKMNTFRSELSNSLLKIETLARNLKRLDTAYVQDAVHNILSSSMQSSAEGGTLREKLAGVCVDEATGAPIVQNGKISFDQASFTYKISALYSNILRLTKEYGIKDAQ